MNFWFGHQGYEYLDLGRFWQIYLFVGLLLWTALVLRGVWPALRQQKDGRSLVFLVVIATVSIGLLFGAGLLYGQHTHISIMEYWRWWVVHLWVEGIFEVFATAIVVRAVRQDGAGAGFGGGDVGAARHDHLPRRRRARHVPPPLFQRDADRGDRARRVFSALEVVPLMVVGFEAYNRAKVEHQHRLAEGLSLAVRVLRERAGVESDRRGSVRLLHQSAARALLHAGAEHDRHPRPRGAVRRLRHARHRPDAVLHARPVRSVALERPPAQDVSSGASTSAWR